MLQVHHRLQRGQRVGFVQRLVVPDAQHARKAHRDAALVARAGANALEADFKQQQIRQLAVADFVGELLQQWQLLRPEVSCSVQIASGTSPWLRADPTLEQALINLLNNAGDASPDGISINVEWNQTQWSMQVRDYGTGIARELLENLGTTIQSSKPDGMGVGLVLSQATLNRLGGSVSLYPQQPRGTLTVIKLPLDRADG